MLAVRPYWEKVRQRNCAAGNAGLANLVGNEVWREKLSVPGRREAPTPVNPPHFFVTGPAVCEMNPKATGCCIPATIDHQFMPSIVVLLQQLYSSN
jgi:hypothetical protein